MEIQGTQKLNAIIVDDELMARENLRMLLEEFCEEINVIATSGNIIEAKEKILELEPDVVFLDIRMPSGAEGFDLLESIPNKKFQVVFVTAFKDYAIKALNANAIHYILKPIDIEDLKDAVKKLIEVNHAFSDNSVNLDIYLDSIKRLSESIRLEEAPKKLTLYHSKGFKIVELSEILRLESDGNYTAFYFKDGSKYLDSKTLKVYEEILLQTSFLRIHKSHIINLNHLREYSSQDGNNAVLNDGSVVPIARGKLSHFLTKAKTL